MEFLLRLCTVAKNVKWNKGSFVISNYHSNYADWMDEFSEQALKMSEKEIAEYQTVLEDFFLQFRVNKVLGMTKKALLESLFVVMEKTDLNVRVTDEIIDGVLGAESYKSSSRQGLVQKGKMNERWKGTYEVLSKYAS